MGLQDVVTALQNVVTGLNALGAAITSVFANVVDASGTN